MVQCKVPSCNNRSDCQGWKKKNASNDGTVKISFHSFPKNPTILRTWLDLLGMPSSTNINNNARICSAHFEEECFDRTTDKVRLKPNKLPQKILTASQDSVVKSSFSDENPRPVFQETDIFSSQPSTSAEKSTMTCADDFPNVCDISQLSETEPSASKLNKGTMVDRSIIFNSPEKSRLRKIIKFLIADHKKKMKLVKQDVKRKNNQVVKFKSILKTLRNRQMLSEVQADMIEALGGSSGEILKRLLQKSSMGSVSKQYTPEYEYNIHWKEIQ